MSGNIDEGQLGEYYGGYKYLKSHEGQKWRHFSVSEHRHDGYQMTFCDKAISSNIVLGHYVMVLRPWQ